MASNYKIHKHGDRDFRIPTFTKIGPETGVLYRAEKAAMKNIDKAAREIGKILGFKKSEFWTHAMPEELATILDSFENGAAEAAAIAYLRKAGFKVEKVEKVEKVGGVWEEIEEDIAKLHKRGWK